MNMLTIRSGRSLVAKASVLTVLSVLGFLSWSVAQQKKDAGPTTGEVLTRGITQMQSGQKDAAIQSFYDYLDMAVVEGGGGMDRAIAIQQDIRYRLAGLLIEENRKSEAAAVLQDYISIKFANHKRVAYKMLVKCYFDLEQHADCAAAVLAAIDYDENPDLILRPEYTSDDDRNDELGGEGDEPDEPFTPAEYVTLRFMLAESYYHLDKFQESLEPFRFVIDNTTDTQQKGYAIMQTINSLLNLDDFDQIIAWVPVLYRSNVRYDIRVNLALLEVADALCSEGEYDSALPLYRMIVPRDELVAYQELHLQEMRIDAGLPPLLGEPLTEDELLLFGTDEEEKDEEEQSRRSSSSASSGFNRIVADEEEEAKPDGFVIPSEITVLEALVEQLKDEASVPPYENFVNLEMAMLYENVSRYWEAVRFYDIVAEADPDGDVGQRAAYEAIELLSGALDAGADAENRAFAFLNEHKNGTYPRYIAYLLTVNYQTHHEWRSLLNLRPYLDSFEESYTDEIRGLDSELYFMQGVGELMMQQYTNACEDFKMVANDFQGTRQAPNGLYWSGFAYLCLDNHQKAYECFDQYTRDYPGGAMLDEAYYQGGIALFGQNKLDQAVERFSYVIDQYGPSSPVYSQACNMRADIYGSRGGKWLDEAVNDYKKAYENALSEQPATYAVFGACAIYKKDYETYGNDYIVKAVNDYRERWGEEGDIAKALLWLGRVMMQEGNYQEAVDNYIDAIHRYGGLIRQDGVDQIIPEMVKLSYRLDEEQRNAIRERLALWRDTTKNPTLALRLRVTLAKFDGDEATLGDELLGEVKDLETAPPPVLDLIAKAALKKSDYTSSEEILRLFKNNFEDSPYVVSAYCLRANALLAAGDYEGAYSIVIETREVFGNIREVSWSQLLLGRIRLAEGKVEEAIDETKNVLGYKEWRGKPYVEANFQLGEIEEQRGALVKAHNYYQRVYYQYQGVDRRLSARGYLAAARCLQKLSDSMPERATYYQDGKERTLKSMLLDKTVNIDSNQDLIAEAKASMSQQDVAAIQTWIDSGVRTNFVVNIEASLENE